MQKDVGNATWRIIQNMLKIIDTPEYKIARSKNYNFTFNKKTGFFARWGKTLKDDPESAPSPEILDIEISTICHGITGTPCPWCYKSNTAVGTYMKLDTFKQILAKFPKTVTQIAFGIGDVDSNPDLWAIMQYCRDHGIVPNITVNGARLYKQTVKNLAKYCGAIAVSLYDYDVCYNAVQQLTDAGMKQVNIHCLLSEETYDRCMQVMKDSKTDPRLKNLGAIVFLWLKPKGDRNQLHQITSFKQYQDLVDYALGHEIRFGFDSCSAASFMNAVRGRKEYQQLAMMAEPCESTLFSYYINVDAKAFPCSFTENEKHFEGIDLLKVKDFIKDVWFGAETIRFRNKLVYNKDIHGCRNCPIFKIGVKKC